jgi:2-iminobutanoate/2-iminopropanoate deaminase
VNRFIELFENAEIDPTPKGFCCDDLIVGLRINGADTATGAFGSGIHEQLEIAYANLRSLVEVAGATTDNIAQVSFFLKDIGDRDLVNGPWIEMFPDPDDRPTYKFMPAVTDGEELVRLEMFAVAGERRRPIHVEGVAHVNPIPMAVKIGRYLFSSRMLPYDPKTGSPADGVEAQADFVFEHASTVLDRAGMTWSDVVQGRAFYSLELGRELITERWKLHTGEMDHVPPLHDIRYSAGDLLVFLEFISIANNTLPATS